MAQHGGGFSRSDRVRKALMREVSDIIAREIKDPVLANRLISVTDVEVTPDMRYAKVFISVMGDAEVQQNVLDVLQTAQPQIRTEVGRRIRLRHTPEIQIHYDDSLVRGARVTDLLNQISRGEV